MNGDQWSQSPLAHRLTISYLRVHRLLAAGETPNADPIWDLGSVEGLWGQRRACGVNRSQWNQWRVCVVDGGSMGSMEGL